MDSALHAILTDIPQAAAIWLVMLAIALVAVSALTVPGRRAALVAGNDRAWGRRVNHAADGEPGSDGASLDDAYPGMFLADDDPRADDRRYADEIAVVVERAAATAARRRADWENAARDAEAAWTAFDAADKAACRARAATAFPVTACPLEDAECERYLHRAATAACRRRELRVAELNEVLAHRGWDPRRQPEEQEVALRHLVRDSALQAYLEATAREREAWHAADVSAAAVRSLRDEAFAARQRADAAPANEATDWLDEQLGRDQLTVPVLRIPELAAR